MHACMHELNTDKYLPSFHFKLFALLNGSLVYCQKARVNSHELLCWLALRPSEFRQTGQVSGDIGSRLYSDIGKEYE